MFARSRWTVVSWACEVAQGLDVVEARDRDVVGDHESMIAEGSDGADGDDVVAGEHAGDVEAVGD